MIIRSFDVPLMVMISSLLAERSFKNILARGMSSKEYIILRFKRLVFPTWTFLIIYFVISAIFCGMETMTYYIDSFCLTRYGIGYVWVILIYLYSAMLVPIFYKIEKNKKSIIVIAIIYIAYEIMYYLQIGVDVKLIDSTFYYMVPYGVLTFLGFNYQAISRMGKAITIFGCLAIFIILLAYYFHSAGMLISPGSVKYPPRLYYLSYGIMCSFVLICLCRKFQLKIFDCRMVKFISSHSMWIYLWHILVLKGYDYFLFPKIWMLKFIVVYVVSAFIVLLVNIMLNVLDAYKIDIKILKYLRG